MKNEKNDIVHSHYRLEHVRNWMLLHDVFVYCEKGHGQGVVQDPDKANQGSQGLDFGKRTRPWA